MMYAHICSCKQSKTYASHATNINFAEMVLKMSKCYWIFGNVHHHHHQYSAQFGSNIWHLYREMLEKLLTNDAIHKTNVCIECLLCVARLTFYTLSKLQSIVNIQHFGYIKGEWERERERMSRKQRNKRVKWINAF